MRNFVKLARTVGDRLSGRAEYCFLDERNHAAEQLFEAASLRVVLRSREFLMPDAPYSAVFASVKNADKDRFESCMAELDRKLLSLHGPAYDAARTRFAHLVETA